MEKENEALLRSARGSRGGRITSMATRERPTDKPTSEANNKQSRKSSNSESFEPKKVPTTTRGTRGSRGTRRATNRPSQRRNLRMRQPLRIDRLKRVQNALRNNQRGQRGRFSARRGFFVMRRRPYSRRSIFIAGLPRNVTAYRLNGLLRKEGRVLRCTLLKDRFGNSRGIAFAEFQSPREAWNVIKKWRGRNVEGNTIYVTFKRNPNRNRNYNSRFNNRFGFRRFNNYGGFNPRYQRQNRTRGNGIRGRGRERGRGEGVGRGAERGTQRGAERGTQRGTERGTQRGTQRGRGN